ncbi:hypothetical protein LXL04_009817 [Taraxacum kok-saghyz]
MARDRNCLGRRRIKGGGIQGHRRRWYTGIVAEDTEAEEIEAADLLILIADEEEGINYVVANSDIHGGAPDLPYLITECSFHKGWMQNSFYSDNVKDLNSNTKNKETIFHPTISQIMPRYYPGMNIRHILCLIEATHVYNLYVTNLYISKTASASSDDKIVSISYHIYQFYILMDNPKRDENATDVKVEYRY